jgi:hypothetical protein
LQILCCCLLRRRKGLDHTGRRLATRKRRCRHTHTLLLLLLLLLLQWLCKQRLGSNKQGTLLGLHTPSEGGPNTACRTPTPVVVSQRQRGLQCADRRPRPALKKRPLLLRCTRRRLLLLLQARLPLLLCKAHGFSSVERLLLLLLRLGGRRILLRQPGSFCCCSSHGSFAILKGCVG